MFDSFWIRASSIETLFTVISPHLKTVFQTVFKFVSIEDYRHEIPKLSTKVDYGDANWSEASLWHFLIHTGYLS